VLGQQKHWLDLWECGCAAAYLCMCESLEYYYVTQWLWHCDWLRAYLCFLGVCSGCRCCNGCELAFSHGGWTAVHRGDNWNPCVTCEHGKAFVPVRHDCLGLRFWQCGCAVVQVRGWSMQRLWQSDWWRASLVFCGGYAAVAVATVVSLLFPHGGWTSVHRGDNWNRFVTWEHGKGLYLCGMTVRASASGHWWFGFAHPSEAVRGAAPM
jgi:hypothetical protein